MLGPEIRYEDSLEVLREYNERLAKKESEEAKNCEYVLRVLYQALEMTGRKFSLFHLHSFSKLHMTNARGLCLRLRQMELTHMDWNELIQEAYGDLINFDPTGRPEKSRFLDAMYEISLALDDWAEKN